MTEAGTKESSTAVAGYHAIKPEGYKRAGWPMADTFCKVAVAYNRHRQCVALS